MRWLAMYLRQVFCKHDFDREEHIVTWGPPLLFGVHPDVVVGSDIKVSATCKKCSYHRSYYKYGNKH